MIWSDFFAASLDKQHPIFPQANRQKVAAATSRELLFCVLNGGYEMIHDKDSGGEDFWCDFLKDR
jgi:hypothetical protein